jgi:hypothetical protein
MGFKGVDEQDRYKVFEGFPFRRGDYTKGGVDVT